MATSTSSSSTGEPEMYFSFTATEMAELIDIAWAFSMISALSSVFIIATIGRFSRLQRFAYKIIMMLAVANLGLDFAYLMGVVGHDNWKCTLQGFGRVYFALVEFALVTAVTTTCYVMIVKRDFRVQEARNGCCRAPR
ncbi:unnamed protein product [Scytosiphon promiscuus]